MIFLPNKLERYTAALRNSIQFLILKNGIKASYIKNISKIYTCEALFSYKEKIPVNIYKYCNKLLLSAHTKLLSYNKKLAFKITAKGNYLLNKKLLTVLLLTICQNGNNIEVFTFKGLLVLSAEIDNISRIKKVISALNGLFFYERKGRKLYILIKANLTDKKEFETKREWAICDPLSPVNIFLVENQ